jgi:receptor expression-enhancing protein 5/6
MSKTSARNAPKASSPLDAVLQNPYVIKAKETGLQYKQKLEVWLRSDENFVAPYLNIAEQKTGVNRVIIFLVFVGVITLYLLFGSYAGFLSHIITFAYPAIGSLRALETRRTDDDTKWLTYWVVFGFLGIFEHFGEAVLSVLPFYYVVKTGFQLWLCLPGVQNGSLIIYERLLRPLASKFLRINMAPVNTNLKGRIASQVDNTASRVSSQLENASTFVRDVRDDISSKLE